MNDVVLVHVKFLSRKHPKYRQYGLWAVVIGTQVVRRRPYRFKQIKQPPTRWANDVLRRWQDGTYAQEAASAAAAREKYKDELLEAVELATRSPPPPPPDDRELSPYERALKRLRETFERRHPDRVPAIEVQPAERIPLSRLHPLMLALADLEQEAKDTRKKRHRSVVNYAALPCSYDELPTKLMAIRYRSIRGMIRRAHHAEWQRRKRSALYRVIALRAASAAQGIAEKSRRHA